MNNETTFNMVKEQVLAEEHASMGIGTLSEKTIHRILKKFYEPNIDYHETALDGYVADIFKDGSVTEIQTANFKKMRDKLSVFLNSYKVKIVHPVYVKKTLVTLNQKTGEIINRRVSPLKENVYDIFYEIYGIKDYLSNPNLSIDVVLLEAEEYRVPTRKNRSKIHVQDRIPTKYITTYEFSCKDDYMSLIPIELGDTFTIKEFANMAKITYETSSITVSVLSYLGLIFKNGKRGRENLYSVI